MSVAKTLIWGAVFIILLVFMILGVTTTSAHEFRSGTNVTTSQNEVIDETLFAYGQNIDIGSEVNGDIFCAGQTVTVSGKVNGDVLCAAQTITISGEINGDVRLAAQTVTINGNVTGNASLAAQSVVIQSSGSVDGDLSTGAESLTINGPIGRDVAVGGSKVIISSSVGRNIKGEIEKIELTSSADVAGSIEYTSKNEIVQSTGATVGGTVNRTEPATGPDSAEVFGVAIAWIIYLFLAMLMTSMAIALLFPSVLQATTDRVIKEPWKALLIGFVASLVVPVALIIIGITIIGIPLKLLLGLIWLVIVFLSGPFTAYYLGRILLTNSRSVLLTMLLGSTVLLVLYFIPFLGLLALIGAYWFGVGMILIELMRRTPRPVYATVDMQESKPKKSNTKPVKK